MGMAENGMNENGMVSLALVQADTVWMDPQANREALDRSMGGGALEGADIALLPETFQGGFGPEAAALAESMDGPTVSWMLARAREHGCALGGSLPIRSEEPRPGQARGHAAVYNRFVFARPDGSLAWYDKRHLFAPGGESAWFAAGNKRVVIEHAGLKLLLLTCYDLRFPVFLRSRGDYDGMLCVANWPAAREDVWTTLLAARALENQCFVAACNRAGVDGTGLRYPGRSALVDCKGVMMLAGSEQTVLRARVDLGEQRRFKERFPVWKDADSFELNL